MHGVLGAGASLLQGGNSKDAKGAPLPAPRLPTPAPACQGVVESTMQTLQC